MWLKTRKGEDLLCARLRFARLLLLRRQQLWLMYMMCCFSTARVVLAALIQYTCNCSHHDVMWCDVMWCDAKLDYNITILHWYSYRYRYRYRYTRSTPRIVPVVASKSLFCNTISGFKVHKDIQYQYQYQYQTYGPYSRLWRQLQWWEWWEWWDWWVRTADCGLRSEEWGGRPKKEQNAGCMGPSREAARITRPRGTCGREKHVAVD